MDTSEWAVVVGAVLLIGFIVWYFFGEREKTEATVSESGRQEVNVTVKGGYAPDTIVVRLGKPVRLNFYRDETSACSEQVIFGDLGVIRDLPAFTSTPIEFTPNKAGEFAFTCGMNMLHGKLVVRA